MTAATQHTSPWLWLPLVFAYVVALALPAVNRYGFGAPTSGLPDDVVPGWQMLVGVPFALLAPSWWANPIWMLGLIALMGRPNLKLACWCGLVGTLLALLVLVIGPFPPDQFQIADLRPGYYVWLGAMIAEFATALCLFTAQTLLGKTSYPKNMA